MTTNDNFEIIKYGCKILRKTSDFIEEIDLNFVEFVEKMAATMYAIDNGVGLAAPQVGINKRLFIIDFGKGLTVYINPEIISSSPLTSVEEEGCLSLPEITAVVERSVSVEVKYFDMEGNVIEEELDEFAARAFQHELDHLDGILFIDRVKPAILVPLSGKLKEIKKIGRLQNRKK